MNQLTQNRIPLTPKEFDELIRLFSYKHFSDEQYRSAREAHPLDPRHHTGVSYVATANFLFRCETCTDIGMIDQWYKLVIDTIGGSHFSQSGTNKEDLIKGYNGSNLLKILKNDKTDYQSSGLNYVKKKGYEGYVCDHCRDTIF